MRFGGRSPQGSRNVSTIETVCVAAQWVSSPCIELNSGLLGQLSQRNRLKLSDLRESCRSLRRRRASSACPLESRLHLRGVGLVIDDGVCADVGGLLLWCVHW